MLGIILQVKTKYEWIMNKTFIYIYIYLYKVLTVTSLWSMVTWVKKKKMKHECVKSVGIIIIISKHKL